MFWVDPADAAKGKIVSLDEETTQWSTEEINTGATDDNGGATNTSKVLVLGTYSASVYPAFAWCATKNTTAPAGISWQIPAKEELKALYGDNNGDTNIDNSVKTAVNTSSSGVSGVTQLSNSWCRSSTGDYANYAWYVNFNDGDTSDDSKGSNLNVGVVSAF